MQPNAIPGLNQSGTSASTGTIAQNPFNNQSVDFGNTAQAQIASKNWAAAYAPSSGPFNSSAQPVVNQQGGTGVSGALNGLTGSSPTTAGATGQSNGYGIPSGTTAAGNGNPLDFNSFMSGAMGSITNATGIAANALGSSYNLTLQNAASANQQIGLQYNTALGGLNTQYNQAFQQLQTQHMNTVGAAVSQMAAANPLGAQSSSFATGYVGKINDMYNQQASFLNSAYGQQQTALANGQASAALGIQQQINSAQASFGQSMAQLMQGQNQALLQVAQTGLGIAQFGYSRQLQSQSLFESTLKGTNLMGVNLPDGTPLVDVNTGKMNISMDDISQNTPEGQSFNNWLSGTSMFAQGIAAGYSPDQIAQSVINGTTEQYNSYQNNLNTQLKYAEAFSKGTTMGGAGGSGGSADTSNLSPLGQSAVQNSGRISLTQGYGGEQYQKGFTDIFTSASQTNLNSLLSYAQNGSSEPVGSVLGPLLNGFFGTDFGSTMSDKDITQAGTLLGVDGKSLSNLSNASAGTRSQVLISALTAFKSKLQGQVQGATGAGFDISNEANGISSTENSIDQAIGILQGVSGGNSSTQSSSQPTSAAAYMSSIGSSWNPSMFGVTQ